MPGIMPVFFEIEQGAPAARRSHRSGVTGYHRDLMCDLQKRGLDYRYPSLLRPLYEKYPCDELEIRYPGDPCFLVFLNAWAFEQQSRSGVRWVFRPSVGHVVLTESRGDLMSPRPKVPDGQFFAFATRDSEWWNRAPRRKQYMGLCVDYFAGYCQERPMLQADQAHPYLLPT